MAHYTPVGLCSDRGNNTQRISAPCVGVKDDLLADPAFRHKLELFHALGARVTGELLADIAARRACLDEIEYFIDRALANEKIIRALGADRWPPLPLREVPRP